MSLNTPDTDVQTEDRIKADVQREAPDSNPYSAVHWLRSLIAGIARRIFDFYRDLNRTEERLFPDTADDETALRWGDIYIGPKNAATTSTGFLVATGTVGGVINPGVLLSAQGQEFEVITGDTIALNAINVLSITRIGDTATVITDGDHNLSSFVKPTITGADQSAYNLVGIDILVTGLDSFTYTVTGSPTTPATGTITASYTTAVVEVTSNDFGSLTNLDADSPVTLQSPIVDVDDTLYVTFGAIGGGADEETTSDYIDRYLDKIRNPVAHFNAADIIQKAKEITGVTRVFVFEITPAIGQVTIYFLRDNDEVVIPSAGEVATVKNKILEIKPANTSDNDVIVLAPTGVNVDFTFTSLTPDTATMRDAIEANIAQFFEERTTVGVDADEDAYRAAIINTVDPDTGDSLQTFTLSAPSGDIIISDGEIGIKGTVTYP